MYKKKQIQKIVLLSFRKYDLIGIQIILLYKQKQLEDALCSGTLSIEELTAKSKRLPQLKDELDEKSLRWLELSEIEH